MRGDTEEFFDGHRKFPEVRVGKSPNCQLSIIEARIKVPMQSLLLSSEMLSRDRSPLAPFNVVIMYEDFESGKRAKKGLDYVAEELGKDLEFRHSMWRLDVLQNPKLNVLAAPALAEADLLIISLRGEGRLPSKIRALIDERLAQTLNHKCALVALFEGPASATRSSVYAHLATLARAHGLDFFEQALSDAENHEDLSLELIWVF
jgi:hypothetical protein